MGFKKILIIISVLSLFGCKVSQQKPASKDKLNYLALGDSYTIGESVEEDGRWPVQLVKELNEDNFSFNPPKIIAQTGWRTDDLLQAMKNEPAKGQYDLVSVLIGVNNQYQNKELEQYKNELKKILENAILYAKSGNENVFMLSIPNYGVTPFGLTSGKENIGEELKEYDKIAQEICASLKIPFYNITDISLEAETNKTLVANDGLHPSEEMYRRWVVRILPQVKALLNN